MDVQARLRKNPSVTYRKLAEGEGGVLLHLESGQYHGIDEIGCLIWTHIDGERTVAGVVEVVRAEVADPPPELEHDVLEFLEGMRSRDLVV
jgi:Coenzyme PQQ synthesis protein D (PqqD)